MNITAQNINTANTNNGTGEKTFKKIEADCNVDFENLSA